MATQERNRVDNFSQTAIGCMRFIGFCSPTASPEQQCCGDRGCSECIGYQTCSRNFSSNIATKIATTTTNVTATIPIDIITKSFMFNNNTTVSKNDTSTLLSTTNLSTTIGATMKSNDTTIGETAVMVLGTEPPPVWIFGVAGGGVVALLLLIGAVALACWCNKRAQPNSAQIVMSSNDTNMSSFRESSSMKGNVVQCVANSFLTFLYFLEQRSNQYAALSSGNI